MRWETGIKVTMKALEEAGQEHRGAQQQVVTCEAQSEGIPHLSVLKQAASASA